jgi:hypothetical protein
LPAAADHTSGAREAEHSDHLSPAGRSPRDSYLLAFPVSASITIL